MRWLIAIGFVAACSSSSSTPDGAPHPDTPIDTGVDVCLTCASGQICVARYDGTCRGSSMCVTRTVDCPLNTCSADCEAAYCPAPYQCKNRPPCGGESPSAFTCYGP